MKNSFIYKSKWCEFNYNQNFGSITENITDVWVYIEDNLQGVYEIPVEFPVLEEGIKNIRVKAGIKANE